MLGAGSLASANGEPDRGNRRHDQARARRGVATLARDAGFGCCATTPTSSRPATTTWCGSRTGRGASGSPGRRTATKKALFVADEDGEWLGVVGGFVRVDPQEVQLISMWVDRAGPRARHRARSDPGARSLDEAAGLDARGAFRPGGERARTTALRTRRLPPHRRPRAGIGRPQRVQARSSPRRWTSCSRNVRRDGLVPLRPLRPCAVVTGASSGIGQAIAFALASTGADIVGLSLDDASRDGGGDRGLGAAQSSSSATRASLATSSVPETAALETFGRLDVWVNNAARAAREAVPRDDRGRLARPPRREPVRLRLGLPRRRTPDGRRWARPHRQRQLRRRRAAARGPRRRTSRRRAESSG